MPRLRTSLLIAATLLCVLPASAGIFDDIYQGLGVYSTPIGSGSGGFSNGARFGRLRVVPNQLGQGYRLELDRTFGGDTRGRAETYDLGAFELELSGATQATFGYTSRGMLIGNGEILANNLNYTLRSKTGAQDFELTGTMSVNGNMEVNQFGFYTLDLQMNNTGSLLDAQGLVVDGDRDTDWSVGPISIQGNVYFDAVVGIMTALGLDTTVFEGVFPSSPIDRINQTIADSLGLDTFVAGEMYGTDSQALSEAAALEARDFVNNFANTVADASDFGAESDGVAVPEPAGLALLGLLALAGLRRR